MFSMTKSRELDEEQRQDADVNKRHYGEDVKFYQMLCYHEAIYNWIKFYIFTIMVFVYVSACFSSNSLLLVIENI